MIMQEFKKNYDCLNSILEVNKKYFGEKEYKFRKEDLKRVYKKMEESSEFFTIAYSELDKLFFPYYSEIDSSYYSLAHEIRSIGLFAGIGNIEGVKIAQDFASEPGVDFIYKDNLIECVICTAGTGKNLEKLKASGYKKYDGVVRDYNEKFKQISLRVLSCLNIKKDKYLEDIEKIQAYKDNYKSNKFCIFINFGSLSTEWFPSKFCNEATRFLIGRGFPVISIDTNSGKQIGKSSYEYSPEIKNNNDSLVITNFFGDKNNECVSAVIISTANLFQKYSKENTFIFLNPFAINKLVLDDFKDFLYWEIDENNEYVPKINGNIQDLND